MLIVTAQLELLIVTAQLELLIVTAQLELLIVTAQLELLIVTAQLELLIVTAQLELYFTSISPAQFSLACFPLVLFPLWHQLYSLVASPHSPLPHFPPLG